MKIHMRLYSVLFLVITSVACNNVVFTEPQPAKVSAESNFPDEWQGIYKNVRLPDESQGGDSWVKVTADQVVMYNKKMDSIPFLAGDYEPGEKPEIGEPVQVMLRGVMVDAVYGADDWAHYSVTRIDTIGLSDTLILKMSDDWAFLNMPNEKHGKKYWDGVLIEKVRNGDLLLWSIEDGEEEADKMAKYFSITEEENPGYAGKLRFSSPKKKEFEAYIEAGGYPDLMMWLTRPGEYSDIPQELK